MNRIRIKPYLLAIPERGFVEVAGSADKLRHKLILSVCINKIRKIDHRYELIEILVGKNAVQNDRLTLGAKPDEMWLHAKDMPGSHVIIQAEGDIPEQTLREAAQLAAWYSKGQRSSMVPIDYTRRKYVKKPGGAAPGKVIYTHQKTAYMTVDESDIRRIRLKEE